MKKIILLLSFVFVSCVTANTESRDLSGVNPQPELSSIDNQFKACVSDCTAKGGLSFWCSDSCLKIEDKKRPHRNLSSHEGPACSTCYTCCIVEGYSGRECAETCSSDHQD